MTGAVPPEREYAAMLAAPASAHPATPGACRLAAVAQFFSELQTALRRVARARATQVGLGLGLAWVAGWFALALPFAYRVAQLPSTERLLDGVALLRGPLCHLVVWLSGTALSHGGRGPGISGQRLAANALALACVVVAFLGLASVAAGALQWFDGRVTPDWALYATGVVNLSFGLCLWAAVAVSLQALVGERRLGTLAAALAFLLALALPKLGAEHPLLHFGPRPMPYSHLAGYGHHVVVFVTTGLHYSALTALLALGAWLLAPRAAGEPWRERLARAKHRLPSSMVMVMPCAVAWVGSGAWICHMAASTLHDAPAAQELAHLDGGSAGQPLPTLLALDLQVELHPHEGRLEAAGAMLLGNQGGERIDALNVYLPHGMQVDELAVPARPVTQDERFHLRRYAFDRPLRPIERIRVTFDMAWPEAGFGGPGGAPGLARNGSVLTSEALVPRFAPRSEHRRPQHPTGMWFKARLGTALDQIAVAPGELKRAWKENDRRYFEYETRQPIAPHFTVYSGRYVVARDRWGDVAIEIFHAPAHAANVPTLLGAVKASLAHCAVALGPYPWAAFRVVEVPHAHAAPAGAGIAAYAEGFAFTADLANRPRSQPVFDAIARDVARQWEDAAAGCPVPEPAT